MNGTILVVIVLLIGFFLFFNENRKKDKKIPDLDIWIINQFRKKDNVNLEDLISEYIELFDVKIRYNIDEHERLTLARTKLKLIEKYDVGRLFAGEVMFDKYKMGLEYIVEMYEMVSHEATSND